MKAILTIGSESFLIPKTTDLNKILDLFQGAKRVRNESLYGPDKARYEEPYYINRSVADINDAEITVTLVADAKVVSRPEWDALEAEHSKASLEFEAKQAAQPVSAGS